MRDCTKRDVETCTLKIYPHSRKLTENKRNKNDVKYCLVLSPYSFIAAHSETYTCHHHVYKRNENTKKRNVLSHLCVRYSFTRKHNETKRDKHIGTDKQEVTCRN